jgi:hypothetical protein
MRMHGGSFCDFTGQRPFQIRRLRGAARAQLVALAAGALFLSVPLTAGADEPRSATEPWVMQEAGEVVSVIDAFDDGDPFDISVSLGFEYSSKSAKILRETHINDPGLTTGGFTANTLNVAAYSETTSKLIPRLDIGIYHDLAAFIRLPVILNNARTLDDLDGSKNKVATVLEGAPGETLFGLPFSSPDRSGLEHIGVGLAIDILNQARDRTKPTWLLEVEGRFSVGEPMHACMPKAGLGVNQPAAGQKQCTDPSDINRNGQTDQSPTGEVFEGNQLEEKKPGVTRGTTALSVRTLLSKRIKYIEPYGGLSALFEFNQDASDFKTTDLEATLVNHPPLVGNVMLGMMVIPWENREKYGRLTFDMRVTGTYHSEGRDYAELFDALGSSDALSLRNPQYARFMRNPDYVFDPMNPQPLSIVDPGSQKTYVTGLSDVQAYGSIRISGSATWQAAEYVKFTFGLGYSRDQGHGITGDQPCNPDFKDDTGKAGPCHSEVRSTSAENFSATGVPNPNYRPTINSVGRRFFVDDSTTFDIFANASVMF